jgi:hypothetical protein
MGVTAIVFEEQPAPIGGDLWAWVRAQRAAQPKGEYAKSETSSNVLNSWFRDMRETFPPLADADPDDLRGTEYSFYRHFIYVVFAGPVSEEGVAAAWKLAHQHGLRVMVGDELLPLSAPEGERHVHITALDGRKAHGQSTRPPNVCIAVLDPSFAPASGTKQWVLDQLDVEEGGSDASILASGLLKQWNDEFSALNLSGVPSEIKLFQKLVLLRLRPKDLHKVAPAAIELAKRLRVGLSVFENL